MQHVQTVLTAAAILVMIGGAYVFVASLVAAKDPPEGRKPHLMGGDATGGSSSGIGGGANS